MKKCRGCGAILQSNDSKKDGYIIKEDSDICQRCFRIRNYGEYKMVEKSNNDFIPILNSIAKTEDLVVLVVDILNINKDLKDLIKYLKNNILLVFTKRDLLSYKISDKKLLNYQNALNIKCVDKIIVSSKNNYQFDLLLYKIYKYKKSNNVYIVGYTNAGKSTLLNKILYNYTDFDGSITTSILPSTTIDTIEIKVADDLTLIDTPGILDNGNIANYLDGKMLKKVLPKKEIKPITYQARSKQYIYIEDLVKIEVSNNNLTFYISNQLKINRLYKDKETNLKENIIRVKQNQDIVISGLGFIKTTNEGVIKVYTIDGVDVYTRDSLI